MIQSAYGNASSVTYFETFGDCGIMESGGAQVFPMYHVFADFGEFAGGRLRPLEIGRERGITGCLLEKEGKSCTLLANLTPSHKMITLSSMPSKMRVRSLHDSASARAKEQPLKYRQTPGRIVNAKSGVCTMSLGGYAVLRLDKI
jgi:hypothetical protein